MPVNQKYVCIPKAVISLLLTFSVCLCAVCGLRMFDEKTTPYPMDGDSVSAMEAQAVCVYPTVILDAGHGGEDGGAVSATGITEKTLNLDIVLRLGDMLTAVGVPVVYTRTDDNGLYEGAQKGKRKMTDLRNRLSVAEACEDGILLSVHMNTYAGKAGEHCSGMQVFYGTNNAGSSALADSITAAGRDVLTNTRQPKAAGSGIYLLYNAGCTAVLAECGFLSNPEEAALLSTVAYRQRIAAVLCGGLLSYLDTIVNNGGTT